MPSTIYAISCMVSHAVGDESYLLVLVLLIRSPTKNTPSKDPIVFLNGLADLRKDLCFMCVCTKSGIVPFDTPPSLRLKTWG